MQAVSDGLVGTVSYGPPWHTGSSGVAAHRGSSGLVGVPGSGTCVGIGATVSPDHPDVADAGPAAPIAASAVTAQARAARVIAIRMPGAAVQFITCSSGRTVDATRRGVCCIGHSPSIVARIRSTGAEKAEFPDLAREGGQSGRTRSVGGSRPREPASPRSRGRRPSTSIVVNTASRQLIIAVVDLIARDGCDGRA